MADTTFVNGATLTDEDWFNDVNRLHYTILGDPANAAAARTGLGSTATGDAVFVAATAAIARTALGVPATTEAILNTLVAAKGDLITATANDTPVIITAGASGRVLMSRSADAKGLAYAAALNKGIYGLTYDNGTDATNDININIGGAMDASNIYWMDLTTALGKQSDVTWAVGGTTGSPLGGLDTGAAGNSDYYIWLIARSDTGVVDALFSLSSTAPSMPTNYDVKRLIGWFKRVAGTIVAFKTYETEGGGLTLRWSVPTLEISLTNTLTTSRRTDAVKVPQSFSTDAILGIRLDDVSEFAAWLGCPDAADTAVSGSVENANWFQDLSVGIQIVVFVIKTSATGTIAVRATISTVDNYYASTYGFNWARRN